MDNVLLVGFPGVGKTAVVEANYGSAMVKLLVSSCVEEDIAGLPYREGTRERRTKPKFLEDLDQVAAEHPQVCLFLDELDKARQEVADTLLTLVWSRRIGDWALPTNCRIIAAANPVEFGGGNGISEPMRSRFIIHDFIPDKDKWADWCEVAYPQMPHIAQAVRTGELPMYYEHGEGYDKRTASPRTYQMAMEAKDCFLMTRAEKIAGLIPAEQRMFFLADPEDFAQILSRKVTYRAIRAMA